MNQQPMPLFTFWCDTTEDAVGAFSIVHASARLPDGRTLHTHWGVTTFRADQMRAPRLLAICEELRFRLDMAIAENRP